MACITNVPRTHKFGVSASGDFGTTEALALAAQYRQISNSLNTAPVYSQDPGHTGTPFYDAAGVTLDSKAATGSVQLQPRADELVGILPLLGLEDAAGGSFSPDVDGYCQYFRCARYVDITTFDFHDCKTSQWSMQSSKSSPRLTMDWGIEACSYDTSGTWELPGTTAFSQLQPFVHTSSVITIDGDAIPIDDLNISGNNNLTTDLFYNSVTRTALPAGRQEYQFTCTTPFNNEAGDPYLTWFALEESSIAASMVFMADDDTSRMTITMPKIQGQINTPSTPSGETPVKMEGIVWTARADLSDPANPVPPITITVETGLTP